MVDSFRDTVFGVWGSLGDLGWRSGPKDSKNIKHLGSVVDGVRDRALSVAELELDLL